MKITSHVATIAVAGRPWGQLCLVPRTSCARFPTAGALRESYHAGPGHLSENLGCREVGCSTEASTARNRSNSQLWDRFSKNEIKIVFVQLTFQFGIHETRFLRRHDHQSIERRVES